MKGVKGITLEDGKKRVAGRWTCIKKWLTCHPHTRSRVVPRQADGEDGCGCVEGV